MSRAQTHKLFHEIRDPIHVFVRLDSVEREVLDSRPFQRLRHIQQLGLSSLVYPGATHNRFEHSLGAMELATRVFDIIARPEALTDEIRGLLKEVANKDQLIYWRRVLRMAALCHDLGHLPFSHAAEDLLPLGWDHERLTAVIIKSPEMANTWDKMTPPLRPDDIVKLAVGPKKGSTLGIKQFSDWEAILAEIIVGDAFGADRMDYLLRDSYYAGVPYGHFDHYRLIDTLRILPSPSSSADGSIEPMLGVEEGGLHCAEALLLARYFMYSQVYLHPIRIICDIHLGDFLKSWLVNGTFPTSDEEHLLVTDAEVTAAFLNASSKAEAPGYEYAQRITSRKHFKVLYKRNPEDVKVNPGAVQAVYDSVCVKYGEKNVRMHQYTEKGGAPDFPVLARDRRIFPSLFMSQTLRNLPAVASGYVFIDADLRAAAETWLDDQRSQIIALPKEEQQ